jgi:hypothetical protein
VPHPTSPPPIAAGSGDTAAAARRSNMSPTTQRTDEKSIFVSKEGAGWREPEEYTTRFSLSLYLVS